MFSSKTFLRRLELSGFKSFANKTVLEFPAGIAAIVGPNGSGKSNIVDALRWVLGEREARQLRSAKLENLIFSGSPKKPSLGLAQVALYFNNESRVLPLEFEEIVISRKADRSGLSEYYLNKAEVRFKDLAGILAQARLGTSGLLIVSQGDSDILIKSTAQERRGMLEEVIGLRQYQLKKSEAERKLASTVANLDKAKAMVEEIKPHIRFLRRQTNRYERHGEILKELENLQNHFFGAQMREFENGHNEIISKLEPLEKSLNEKLKESALFEANLKKMENEQPHRKDLAGLRSERQKIAVEQARIQKDLGRLEGRLEYLLSVGVVSNDFPQSELMAAVKDARQILDVLLEESDVSAIKSQIQILIKKLDKFSGAPKENKELEETAVLKEKLSAELEKFNSLIQELADKEAVLTADLERLNTDFRKAFGVLEESRKAVSGLETEKNNLMLEKDKISFRKEELSRQAKEWGTDLAKMENGEWRMENNENLTSPDLEKKIFKLRGELAGIGEIDEASLKEARETETRYDFLSNQINDLEKAGADLKILINELRDKIDKDFRASLQAINEEFSKYFRLMFGGGKAKFVISRPVAAATVEETAEGGNASFENSIEAEPAEEKKEQPAGLEIDLVLPKKKVRGLAALSGGERSLVSLAALFALIAVNPPPFLVLDEIDAPLDELNAKRFSTLLKEFSSRTQFLIVTHNRSTMEAADVLYGVTMGDDGVSKILSLKLES
ncbi:MAG: AAA family ATPase [Patescibacteria group bacterium]